MAVFQGSGKIKITDSGNTVGMKKPAVDLGVCTKCGGCIEVAPKIFRFNEAAGFLEVCDLDYYDQGLVDEAIKNCPEDCIYWEQD